MVDWKDPNWGKPGQNVTHADNGSWDADEEKKEDE